MNSQFTTFEMPRLTPEQWTAQNERAKAAKEAEARAAVMNRIRNSGIPREYLKADIRVCHEGVKAFSRSLRADLSPSLLLKGKVGRGKTYSACAALLAASDKKLIRFVPASVLTLWANPFNTEGAEMISRCKGTGVLAIDDLGKETPDKNTVRILWEIINHRLYNGLPTIITTQYVTGLSQRLAESGQTESAKAIASRLHTYSTVVLTGEDRRLQCMTA